MRVFFVFSLTTLLGLVCTQNDGKTGRECIPRISIGEVDQRREGHLSNANIFAKASANTRNVDKGLVRRMRT